MSVDALFLVNHLSPIAEFEVSRFGGFGDPQRVIKFEGEGASKTLIPESRAGQLQQDISNAIINNGWSLQTIKLTPTIFSIYPYYYFTIWINALPNDDPERVRNGLHNLLSFFFDNLALSYSNDNLYVYNPVTGQTDITDAYKDKTPASNQPSLWEQIFGKNTSAIDAGGKVLGLSVGTIALLGIGYLVISRRK